MKTLNLWELGENDKSFGNYIAEKKAHQYDAVLVKE